MKIIVILSLFLFANAQDKYESLDDFDISQVLNNDRLLISYAKCLINKGPCTPDIKKVKDKIPEILETKCSKCSDRQKEIGKRLIKEVRDKHPELWSDLSKYYDPQGKYQQSFQEFLNN